MTDFCRARRRPPHGAHREIHRIRTRLKRCSPAVASGWWMCFLKGITRRCTSLGRRIFHSPRFGLGVRWFDPRIPRGQHEPDRVGVPMLLLTLAAVSLAVGPRTPCQCPRLGFARPGRRIGQALLRAAAPLGPTDHGTTGTLCCVVSNGRRRGDSDPRLVPGAGAFRLTAPSARKALSSERDFYRSRFTR